MNNMEIQTTEGFASQIEKANNDSQIAIARRYPRDLGQVKAKMKSFATLDQETAESCFYTLPGRKGGDGKPIQGPSVRMAEIALTCYQHVKAGARIVNDDGSFVTAQAVVMDIENNVSVSVEVRRRITTKEGRRYSDDMIAVTCNAACSIALRNAVFRVVPLALVKPVYEAAKQVAVGDVKSLVKRRAEVVEKLIKMGAVKERIFAAVDVPNIEGIDVAKLETLIGFGVALRDNDITLEDAFPGEKEAEGLVIPPAPEKPAKEQFHPPTGTIQDQLANVVCAAGLTFDDLLVYLVEEQFVKPDTISSFDEIPDAIAGNLVKASAKLIEKLKA